MNLGENAIITGYLYDKDNHIPNQKINFYVDEVNIANITTDSEGNFNYNVIKPEIGYHTYYAEYISNGTYCNVSTSTYVFWVVEQKETILTITNVSGVNYEEIKYGDPIQITGTLTDIDGNPIQDYNMYCPNIEPDILSCNEEGIFIIQGRILTGGNIN